MKLFVKKSWLIWGDTLLGIAILGIVVFVFQANANDAKETKRQQDLLQQAVDSQKSEWEARKKEMRDAKEGSTSATTTPTPSIVTPPKTTPQTTTSTTPAYIPKDYSNYIPELNIQIDICQTKINERKKDSIRGI